MALITKLDGEISNPSLRKLGAIMLHSKAVDDPVGSKRVFGVGGNVELRIIGDPATCHFTDVNLAQNQGQTKSFTSVSGSYVWTSNADFDIEVTSKYDFLDLILNSEGVFLNVDEIPYCVNLKGILLYSTSTYGDIKSFETLEKLETIKARPRSLLEGDISALKNLPLKSIEIQSCKVGGDIAELANMTELTELNLRACTGIYGDVASLGNLTNLTVLRLGEPNPGVNTKIVGNIASLGRLINATTINLGYTGVTGTCEELAQALKANGKTSGSVSIRQADGTSKTFDFPI